MKRIPILLAPALVLLAFAAWRRFGQVRHAGVETGETIHYYTRGMANLLESRRYAGDLAMLLVSNFRKEQALGRSREVSATAKGIEDMLGRNPGKKPGARTLRALYRTIRGNDDGDTGIR